MREGKEVGYFEVDELGRREGLRETWTVIDEVSQCDPMGLLIPFEHLHEIRVLVLTHSASDYG